MGISDSLIIFEKGAFIKKFFPKEKSWYRLLHFLGVEKSTSSEVVKNVIQAKNTVAIMNFLNTTEISIPKKNSGGTVL